MDSIPAGKPQHNSTKPKTFFFILKITVLILFSFFLIFSGHIRTLLEEGTGKLNSIRCGRKLINDDKMDDSPSKLPLCVGKLLDQRQYLYAKEIDASCYDSRSHLLITESGQSCQLLSYTAERIAHCFDALGHQKYKADSLFRFIFMGDSIIRQHYLNFVRLIPDYDKLLEPSNAALLFQGDMEVTSVTLGLRLSFRWQPYVDDDVVKKLRQWTETFTYNNTTRRSSLVLLGMAVWHMFDVYHRDHRRYEKEVSELAPALAELSKVTRVIWLSQYPPVEFYGDNKSPNTYVSSVKINNYNKAVRRILLTDTGSNTSSRVEIWDSGNPLVEEYVRSCGIHRRFEKKKISPGLLTLKYYSGAYRNCRSDVHAGYAALSQITQLLYNDICSPSQM